jgi:hypothetical protein
LRKFDFGEVFWLLAFCCVTLINQIVDFQQKPKYVPACPRCR